MVGLLLLYYSTTHGQLFAGHQVKCVPVVPLRGCSCCALDIAAWYALLGGA